MTSAVLTLIAAVLAGTSSYAQHAEAPLDDSLFGAPQDGGARRWEVVSDQGLELHDAPAGLPTGQVVLDRTVLGNFGCTEIGDRRWCEIRPLHGGPRGYVSGDGLGAVAGPDGVVARGMNDSARRASRKQFDLTAEIPCAQEVGQALGACKIGIARSDGGDATAAVTFDNGFTRLLYFMHGQFISASATMSGAGRDTDWQVNDGVHLIRADDQRFEIPDALLFGE